VKEHHNQIQSEMIISKSEREAYHVVDINVCFYFYLATSFDKRFTTCPEVVLIKAVLLSFNDFLYIIEHALIRSFIPRFRFDSIRAC
jgi:hypothetical protein